MKLNPPIEQYLSGAKPTHTTTARIAENIKFLPQKETVTLLKKGGYVGEDNRPNKKALQDGLLDQCESNVLWNIKNTKIKLLELSRKPSIPKVIKPVAAQNLNKINRGEVWTDLENVGTYFGVGKNKVGTWLDQIGLRGYKPRQVNESGDLDMLDLANESKEKFRMKIPTEKAIERGFARVEIIDYKSKGQDKSFEKFTWNLEMTKAVLVKAGHELDTERKLLNKGKGKNSNVQVSGIDERALEVLNEYKKTKNVKVFEGQNKFILNRIEILMGKPKGYLVNKEYLKK